MGATTRAGLLTSPLRDRFGINFRLKFYEDHELSAIVTRSAKLLNIEICPKASLSLAKRSRGTPRIANRLLKRVRDFSQIAGQSIIEESICHQALNTLNIDQHGLDQMDQYYLTTLLQKFNSGPVGLNAFHGSQRITRHIEDIVEPYSWIEKAPRSVYPHKANCTMTTKTAY